MSDEWKQAPGDDHHISGVWSTSLIPREEVLNLVGRRPFVWRPFNRRVLGLDLYSSEYEFAGRITCVESEGEDESATFSLDIDSSYREVRASWWRRTLYKLATWARCGS